MKENNRMSYKEFLTKIMQQVRKELGTGYRIELHQVLKNNGVVLDGILITQPRNKTIPNFYVMPYYKKYQKHGDFKAAVADLLKDYEKRKINTNEIFDFDFEQRKDTIIYRIVNRKKNEKLLENLPHDQVLDLAVTYHCLMQEDEEGIGMVQITKEHLTMWEVTLEEVRSLAVQNTPRLFPAVLQPITTILEEFFDLSTLIQEESSPVPSNMYVLTNQKGINGASCILYPEILENFSKQIGSDFYILPSSIHEVVLVTALPDTDTLELSSMVSEINQTQVAKEEVLSNQAYLYSKVKEELQQLF